MTTIFEPGATSRDVISCALSLDLDQYREILGGFTVPRQEWSEQLEAVTLGVNSNIDGDPVHRRRLVCILTGVVATGWELLATGIGKLERLAVRASKSVGQWVKAKIARESKGSNDVGRSNEGVRGRIRIITTREITVIRRENCKPSARIAFCTKCTYSN
jgi:hypothetical protein